MFRHSVRRIDVAEFSASRSGELVFSIMVVEHFSVAQCHVALIFARGERKESYFSTVGHASLPIARPSIRVRMRISTASIDRSLKE